jgi:hypothetical protein
VLIQSEELWTNALEASSENRGTWHEGAARAMMSMSSIEWSDYLHDALDVRLHRNEFLRR